MKVHQSHATVADFINHATEELTDAKERMFAAKEMMSAALEAKRRAKGNLSTLLSDVRD
jgi:hypothetical protein